MKPNRLRYTFELLDSYRAFDLPNSRLVDPIEAKKSDIHTFHTEEYTNAVESLSRGENTYNPSKYNFSDHGDNPIYQGMYEASILSTGASLVAANMIYDGKVDVAFNVSGGLHHAMPRYASGFCIFNDPVIAINYLLSKGLRVVYVDIDAHHGDGVQHAYYSTDQVLTISIHESGQFLFPGTGSVEDIGIGKGLGYSVNIPLHPYSNDEVYMRMASEIMIPLIDSFRPDVLATQLGMDTYFRDPITHLGLSVQGHSAIVKKLGESTAKWLAFGGGGYDLSAVARGWTLDYGTMLGEEWPDTIPSSFSNVYSIPTLLDHDAPTLDIDTIYRVEQFSELTMRQVKELLFPIHNIT
jgi:acetoin utilization protein AcuC